MTVWEGKKYKLVKSDNYDEYLKELGVGLTLRKMCNAEVPTIELQQKDSMYELTNTTEFQTTKIQFRLNQEFDEVTFDGRNVKSSIQKQFNNFMHQQVGANALPTTIIWQFSSTELLVTLTVERVKAVQLYRTESANAMEAKLCYGKQNDKEPAESELVQRGEKRKEQMK